MSARSRSLVTRVASSVVLAAASSALAAPLYTITNLGPITNSTAGSGQGISPSGNFATGFANISSAGGGGSRTTLYSAATGTTTALPNLVTPTRNFSQGRGVNDFGTIVGTGASTFFGSSGLPVLWKNGVATALPLPSGQSGGRAFSINNDEVSVGSVGGGSVEFAATFALAGSTVLTQTTTDGGRLTTAYGINNAGRIVGQALSPTNAAITVPWYLDPGASAATIIPPLPEDNAGIAFAVASNGFVAGSSSFNGANGVPFLWTPTTGSTEVPLPTGASTGSARGVNKNGWVVGTASSAFALPFLYDGTQTYLIQDLLTNPAGWNLFTNTSSAALGIADDGSIVGQGVFNNVVSGYVLTPVPEPTSAAVLVLPAAALLRRRR